MKAEHGVAGIGVAWAGYDVEQHLAHRHQQEEQRPHQADADVSPVIAVADVADDAEADAEHSHALQQAQRTWDLARGVLQDHRRREDRGEPGEDREQGEIGDSSGERRSRRHAGLPERVIA